MQWFFLSPYSPAYSTYVSGYSRPPISSPADISALQTENRERERDRVSYKGAIRKRALGRCLGKNAYEHVISGHPYLPSRLGRAKSDSSSSSSSSPRRAVLTVKLPRTQDNIGSSSSSFIARLSPFALLSRFIRSFFP